MRIRDWSSDVCSSDLDRRRFLAGMGIGVAALSLPLTACGANDKPAPLAALKLAKRSEQAGGEKLTEFETVSTYNNYYEFGTDKSDPSRNAHTLRTRPWTIKVDGECEAPGTVDIDTLLAGTLEERIYRHRCVEAWSIVVPWDG